MTREALALALYTMAPGPARAVEAAAYRMARDGAPALPRHILLADRPRYDMCSRIADRALRGALPAPVQ